MVVTSGAPINLDRAGRSDRTHFVFVTIGPDFDAPHQRHELPRLAAP